MSLLSFASRRVLLLLVGLPELHQTQPISPAAQSSRYVTQENALAPKWGVTAAPASVLTFHFKWLASAVQKLRDRLAHHRGKGWCSASHMSGWKVNSQQVH